MKSPIVRLVVFGSVLITAATTQAQIFGKKPPRSTPPTAATNASPAAAKDSSTPAPLDPQVLPSGSVLPGATPIEELKPLAMELPDDPIEPYLLTKDVGPYLVLAKNFRGPEAERLALALVKELRNDYKLPAFILRTKDFPGKSNIRGIPPTAEPEVRQARLSDPEKVRTYDEAAVMVGNEKTKEDSEKLLKQVKKIKPKCLNDMPKLFAMHENLSRAFMTTNPYVPAQYLFPQKKDKLIVSMNSGPQSIVNCPGQYSLMIANFTGRSTFKTQDDQFKALAFLKSSPLATAHDDAERLASKLLKQPEIQKMGQPVYVYHDRSSSRVYIGSFTVANDPKAVALRDAVLQNAVKLCDDKRPGGSVGNVVVPASYLTDVAAIKQNIK